MGDELRATSRGYDLAQIERDWTIAQARIDALAAAGTQAIQRLVQDLIGPKRLGQQGYGPGRCPPMQEVRH